MRFKKTHPPNVFCPPIPNESPLEVPKGGALEPNSPPLVDVGLNSDGFDIFPNILDCVFKFNPPPNCAVEVCGWPKLKLDVAGLLNEVLNKDPLGFVFPNENDVEAGGC